MDGRTTEYFGTSGPHEPHNKKNKLLPRLALLFMLTAGGTALQSENVQAQDSSIDQPSTSISVPYREATPFAEIQTFMPEVVVINENSPALNAENVIQINTTTLIEQELSMPNNIFKEHPTESWLNDHKVDGSSTTNAFYRESRDRFLNPESRIHDIYVSKQLIDRFPEMYKKTADLLKFNGYKLSDTIPSYKDFIGSVFAEINKQLEDNNITWKYERINIIEVDESVLDNFQAVSVDYLQKDSSGWWPAVKIGSQDNPVRMPQSLFADTVSSLSLTSLTSGDIFSPNYIDVTNEQIIPGALMTTIAKDFGLQKSWTATLFPEQIEQMNLTIAGKTIDSFQNNLFSPAWRSPTVYWKGQSTRMSPLDANFLSRYTDFSWNPMAEQGYIPMPHRRATMVDGTVATVYNANEFNVAIWPLSPEHLMPGFRVELPEGSSFQFHSYTAIDRSILPENTLDTKHTDSGFDIHFNQNVSTSHYVFNINGLPIVIPYEYLEDIGLNQLESHESQEMPVVSIKTFPDAIDKINNLQHISIATIYLNPGELDRINQLFPGLIPYAKANTGNLSYDTVWVAYDSVDQLGDIVLRTPDVSITLAPQITPTPEIHNEISSQPTESPTANVYDGSIHLNSPVEVSHFYDQTFSQLLQNNESETASIQTIQAFSPAELSDRLWQLQGMPRRPTTEQINDPEFMKQYESSHSTHSLLFILPESAMRSKIDIGSFHFTQPEIIALTYGQWLPEQFSQQGITPAKLFRPIVAIVPDNAINAYTNLKTIEMNGNNFFATSDTELFALPSSIDSVVSLINTELPTQLITERLAGEQVSFPVIDTGALLFNDKFPSEIFHRNQWTTNADGQTQQLDTLLNGWGDRYFISLTHEGKYVGIYPFVENYIQQLPQYTGQVSYQFMAHVDGSGSIPISLITLGKVTHEPEQSSETAQMLETVWTGPALDSPLHFHNLVAEVTLLTGEKVSLPLLPIVEDVMNTLDTDHSNLAFDITVLPNAIHTLGYNSTGNRAVAALVNEQQLQSLLHPDNYNKMLVAYSTLPINKSEFGPLYSVWYTDTGRDSSDPYRETSQPVIFNPKEGGNFLSWLLDEETTPFHTQFHTPIFHSNEQAWFTYSYLNSFIAVDQLKPGDDLTRKTQTFRAATSLWEIAFVNGDVNNRTAIGQEAVTIRMDPHTSHDLFYDWQSYYENRLRVTDNLSPQRDLLIKMGQGSKDNLTDEERNSILTDFLLYRNQLNN